VTETDWTPDFTTVQDFAQLLGEDGVKLINEAVVAQAVTLGLAETKIAVADMTAQEAAIPHPNEMGLLGGFVRSVEAGPRGRTKWEVAGKVKDRLVRERALVEGSIGTIKCPKYGFNKPAARSAAMMGVCGQRAVLGLNLTKLIRGVAKLNGVALAA
jgi:hypothetical protein